jgi:hypothetical protein
VRTDVPTVIMTDKKDILNKNPMENPTIREL